MRHFRTGRPLYNARWPGPAPATWSSSPARAMRPIRSSAPRCSPSTTEPKPGPPSPGERHRGPRMPAFTIGDIVRGSGGALLGGDLGIAVAGISIDSRNLGVGEAFFAIRGERLDGHGFLRDAVGRGAACLVIHSVPDDLPPGVPVVLVDETTKA